MSHTGSFNGNEISQTPATFPLYYAMQNYLVVYKDSNELLKMLSVNSFLVFKSSTL